MKTFAPEAAKAPFDLCGGHPALDFVNSFDDRFGTAGPRDLLTGYDVLLRFAEEAGLLNRAQRQALASAVTPATAAKVLRSALELREAMAAVLYAEADERIPTVGEIEMLERHFHEAERPRHLHWAIADAGAHASLQWQWGSEQMTAAGFPVWLIAHSAAQLMLSGALGRVRACEADTCRWLFLDTSKNNTRRWCNMKVCGNRAKARRFQQRRTV